MTWSLVLDNAVYSTLSNTANSIASSILKIAPEIILFGLAVRGVFFIINKIPIWFQSFLYANEQLRARYHQPKWWHEANDWTGERIDKYWKRRFLDDEEYTWSREDERIK